MAARAYAFQAGVRTAARETSEAIVVLRTREPVLAIAFFSRTVAIRPGVQHKGKEREPAQQGVFFQCACVCACGHKRKAQTKG